MKEINIVRHGDYFDCRLTNLGRRQIQKMAETIKAGLNGQSVSIMSSNAQHCKESAKIIADLLGVGFESYGLLWIGPDSVRGNRTDCPKVIELAIKTQADVVIIVTHLEYTEELPHFVAELLLGGTVFFPSAEVGKGEGWVIDIEKKTCNMRNPVYA